LPAKRPERTMQYPRPPSPASRAPTMLCVGHESVVVLGPCRSWLASEEARKNNAILKAAFAGKPAPTMLCVGHESLAALGPCRSWLASEEAPKEQRSTQGRLRRQARAPTMFCVGHESVAVLGPVGAGLSGRRIAAKRPERTMQYPRPPSPASRAPTMFCVSHESVVVFGPELPVAAIF
jgi:hypothetical protein